MKLKTWIAACLFAMLFASLAQAQATRTWVSGVGDDVNPCSRTAPCKTFAGAISKTASGGEIDALDPAGFGAVTITKPITIDGGGFLASVLNSGVNGIVINPPGAADNVVLRNLSINGAGTGVSGVRILNGKNIVLQNVNIFGQGASSNPAIFIATTLANASVSLQNVAITNNASQGINCQVSSGNARLMVYNSRIDENGAEAINLVSNCRATITNSSLSFNLTGVFTRASTTDANIANSDISFNTNGVFAQSSSIWLYATRMNHNQFPINTLSGGDVRTHGNNAIVNNVDPTLPPVNVGQQ
jgi:hypothetical protein